MSLENTAILVLGVGLAYLLRWKGRDLQRTDSGDRLLARTLAVVACLVAGVSGFTVSTRMGLGFVGSVLSALTAVAILLIPPATTDGPRPSPSSGSTAHPARSMEPSRGKRENLFLAASALSVGLITGALAGFFTRSLVGAILLGLPSAIAFFLWIHGRIRAAAR